MKARKVKGLEPKAPLRANAALILATRLAELRGLAGRPSTPPPIEAQHDMRIAAKRLRYVARCDRLLLRRSRGGRAGVPRRELQEVLGEIHDCDVMLPRVAEVDSVRGPAANPPRAAPRPLPGPLVRGVDGRRVCRIGRVL